MRYPINLNLPMMKRALTSAALITGLLTSSLAWAAPVLTITNPTNGATVSGTVSVTASGTGFGNLTKVEFYRDGAVQTTDLASPWSWSWATTGVADGTHTLYARGYDKPTRTWTTSGMITVIVANADTTPPTGTITINSDAAFTSTTAVTLTLMATDDRGTVSQMQFSNDGTSWSTPEAYAVSKAWTLASGDGLKTVRAKFKDPAGNWSVVASDTITLDTTAPATPTVTDDGETTAVNDRLHATWTSSDAQSGVAEYQWAIGTSAGAADVAGWVSVGTATEGIRTGLALQEGTTYYINVKAKNGAGSWSAVGASNGIRYAAIAPPQVRIDAPAAGFTTNALAQDVAGTVTAEAPVDTVTITATTGGTPQAAQTAPVANGHYSASVALEREGAATILVEATDTGGRRGSATVSGAVDRTPPALDVTSPEPGTVFTE